MQRHVDYDRNGTETEVQLRYPEQNAEYLAQLRARLRLDEVLAGATTDLETLVRLTGRVHALWEHSGSQQPSKRDPLSIVEEAERGGRFRCVEYAIVLAGALHAVGIPARCVGLMKRRIEKRFIAGAHFAVEAFLKDQKRWAFADPQWNIVPVHEGLPLSGVQVLETLQEGGTPRTCTPETQREIGRFWRCLFLGIDRLSRSRAGHRPPVFASEADRELAWYWPWLRQYLYYFAVRVAQPTYDGDETAQQQTPPPRLLLVPLGAIEPKVSHRRFPFTNYSHTNSIATFYADPD